MIARPRNRAALLEDPEYYALRERLMGFLEDHAVAPAGDAQESGKRKSLQPVLEPSVPVES